MDDFDRSLPSWVAVTGPDDVPDPVVERALTSARRLDQRSRLALTVSGEAWPSWTGATPMVTLPRRLLVIGLLGLLALTIVAASLLVAAQPHRDATLVTVESSPLLTRDETIAVTLDDGRVLIVGGANDAATMDAALVDPVDGHVDAIPMIEPRGWAATATKLPDGRVLVTGGLVGVGGPITSGDVEDTRQAEVFDPATDRFTAVEYMSAPRGFATVLSTFTPRSVTLADGRILIVGGTTEQEAARAFPSPGDVFDPATDTFSQTPPLPCRGESDGGFSGQEVRSADLLPDGRVLLTCEGWSHPKYADRPAAPMAAFAFEVEDGSAEPLDLGLDEIDGTLQLPDGSILMWSPTGEDRLANGDRLTRHGLARYDPIAGSLSRLDAEIPTGSALALLGSGHVVAAGGYAPGALVAGDAVQFLNPCSGDLREVGTLNTTRSGGTISEFGDALLLVGGQLGQDPDMWEPAAAEIVPLPELPAITCGA